MKTPTPGANIVFGQRLRDVRKDRGWTLRFLAAKAGVHWTYLGQVERGERNVSLLTILRLAKALGIDAGVLLRGLRADTGGDDEAADADADAADADAQPEGAETEEAEEADGADADDSVASPERAGPGDKGEDATAD